MEIKAIVKQSKDSINIQVFPLPVQGIPPGRPRNQPQNEKREQQPPAPEPQTRAARAP